MVPERFEIGGRVIEVPIEVEAEGRAAIAAWHDEQVRSAGDVPADTPHQEELTDGSA